MTDGGAGRAGRPDPSSVRARRSVVITLVVVCFEFLLLYGVYHRADPIRSQLTVQTALSADVATASALLRLAPDASVAALIGRRAAQGAQDAVRDLYHHGAEPADMRALVQAQQRLAAAPGDPTALHRLGSASAARQAELDDRLRDLDHQASAIYITLLVGVSTCWFFWFRRVVTRQRALQSVATEQQALAASEERLLALVQNGSDLVMVLDADWTASYVSPSALAVLGIPGEQLLGARVSDHVAADDIPLLVQLLAGLRSGEDEALTLRMNHADGRPIVVEGVLTNLLAQPAVSGYVLTVRDVTDRHALQERLTYQAFHDPLTGLANRQLFADRLGHALERRPDTAGPLVVLFCDLDDFKNVNDTHGHGLGDAILKVLGLRIQSAIRSGDTAARLGGDEFGIMMESTDLAAARILANRLVRLLSEPVTLDGITFPVTASIGMAEAMPGQVSSEEVLRNADVAMYWAKERGKSMVAAYDSALHAQALDRLELRSDLQRALREDELLLHYQPTIELETGRIQGFEALVRWQHPTRGLVSPGFFIPLAEQSGLIVQLGTWVLLEACRTGALLQRDWRRPSMAVNVSAQQLARPEFVAEVQGALAESGLPGDRLVLEITESAVLKDLQDVIPRLTELRAAGVKVAIDDFGTGYSSLAYLTDLPIDVIKVDKSFIDRVASDDQGASVTEAIIRMSHSMNLTTVAEGVEVAEQAAWLRRVNCPVGQGYFWSRPVDLAGVHDLLSKSVAGLTRALPDQEGVAGDDPVTV
jgi:diguanylate cyclase (GGDEF)-like protein/PAS domain S-box-containing protein